MSHPEHLERLAPVEDEQTRIAKSRLGQTINARWHLDELLGIGGMASVYAATHRNGKRVAVKLLHPELSRNGELRQRFLDEGYAANRVGHPAAVSVLDDGVSEDGAVFLVMDLLEGETLEARIRRYGTLTSSEVLFVTDALLDVLAEAHDKEIIHRDVKPDNVFITQEGEVKLLDFGIARMIKPGRARTTQSGAAMGTPAFMPPEQARGRWEPLDGRTDIWAVGATMFSALTGRQVHEGETTNEELLLAMTEPAPSLGEVAPQVPLEVARIVDQALAFDKGERWPDARTMQGAIRDAAAIVGGLPTPASKSRTSSADSASPVALSRSSAIGRRILTASPKPLPKSARVLVPMVAGILGLVLIVVLGGVGNGTRNGASAASSDPSAANAPVATAVETAEVPTLAVDVPLPSEVSSAEPEPVKPPEPKPIRAKTAHTSTAEKGVSRAAVAGVQMPTSVVSQPAPPLTVDPLERRK